MDNYEDLSLDQLDQLDLDYFRRHRSNGGTSEFDLSINDISRARIEAFRRERGACFLSNINLQGRERDNPDYRFTPPLYRAAGTQFRVHIGTPHRGRDAPDLDRRAQPFSQNTRQP